MGPLLVLIILSVLFVLYKRWMKIFDYWSERGVVFSEPKPLFGNMLPNVLRKKRVGQIVDEICLQHEDSALVGMYNFTSPALIVNDLDYAHIVLIKEFSHFADRNVELTRRRTIDKHLFTLTGVEWKAVRTKMTPVFTTGKLKGMFHAMEKCFENVEREADRSENRRVNVRDLTDLYSVNVRGSCVFGLESDLDKTFTAAVEDISNFNFIKFVRLVLTIFFPRLAVKLDVSILGHDLEKYIADLLMDTIKKRSETGTGKNDFVQTLMQLKQRGSVEVNQWSTEDDYLKTDESTPTGNTTTSVEIDDDHLVAQSMIFLVAGLDVLKSSIVLALTELAKDRRILDRLRQEVDTAVEKHRQFSYQAVREMKYLEMCLKETLRLYPPAEMSLRHCIKSFVFPDGTTVEKGTNLFVPINRFHWDPTLFPDPKNFNPERFSDGPDPPGYMPFGMGPRMCIAMRFAMLEMKVFLAKFIYSYDFALNPATELPVKFDNWFFLLKTVSPVYVDLTRRRHETPEE